MGLKKRKSKFVEVDERFGFKKGMIIQFKKGSGVLYRVIKVQDFYSNFSGKKERSYSRIHYRGIETGNNYTKKINKLTLTTCIEEVTDCGLLSRRERYKFVLECIKNLDKSFTLSKKQRATLDQELGRLGEE